MLALTSLAGVGALGLWAYRAATADPNAAVGGQKKKKKGASAQVTHALRTVKQQIFNPSPTVVFGRNLVAFGGFVYVIHKYGDAVKMNQV